VIVGLSVSVGRLVDDGDCVIVGIAVEGLGVGSLVKVGDGVDVGEEVGVSVLGLALGSAVSSVGESVLGLEVGSLEGVAVGLVAEGIGVGSKGLDVGEEVGFGEILGVAVSCGVGESDVSSIVGLFVLVDGESVLGSSLLKVEGANVSKGEGSNVSKGEGPNVSKDVGPNVPVGGKVLNEGVGSRDDGTNVGARVLALDGFLVVGLVVGSDRGNGALGVGLSGGVGVLIGFLYF
jgi:hypothetical protein